MMHHFWKATIAVFIGFVLAGLLLEGLCRMLPVNETLLSMPVDDQCPVLRFAPNRTTLWSKGPLFSLRNTVHANNYGFLNDQDYDPKGSNPLVAVIGDSFIEAIMVPYTKTGQGLLAEVLSDKARVYSFGRSGAALCQYMAYAEWTRNVFRPNKIIVVIVGNDFDESLLKYKSDAGFHYYKENAEHQLELVRQDYRPGWGVRIVHNSRLLMYLMTNVQVLSLPQRLKYSFQANLNRYVGNTNADADPVRVADSKMAVDKVLQDFTLRTGLAPKDICFVVDGLRPHLYTPEGLRAAANSYVAVMSAYFLEKARSTGFQVIDMQPIFFKDFTENRQIFDYAEIDSHWNERGHALFAKAVLGSGFLKDLTNGQAQ